MNDSKIPQGIIPPLITPLDVSGYETVSLRAQFEDVDEDWLSTDVWRTIQIYSPEFTSGYFLNAVDMKKGSDGAEMRPENEQIYIKLFIRTMFMSMVITCSCILLGYPVALSLAGTSLIFAGLGIWLGGFDASYLHALPSRLYGILTNTTLIAVPLFVFMGVLLEKSKIAEQLLNAMAQLLSGLEFYRLKCLHRNWQISYGA